MTLVKSPTELTTSATDLLLAIECLLIMIFLWQAPAFDRWRTYLWCSFFGLLAISSFFGALAHGLDMQASRREAFFGPIFLSLGVVVVLLAAGALFDWSGRDMAKRLVWLAVPLSIILFISGRFFKSALVIFIIYEALAFLAALAIYSFLAVTHKLDGSVFISLAILLSLVAAGAQASPVSMKIHFPFDHNGIFHLIEMAALALLGWGLKIGMKP
ncbi:MAG: hypothetical protein HY787_08225 [Deltaproteobacteria bacterium]|nr:hypothetical protein [Deltaproteobacteria bacterium]